VIINSSTLKMVCRICRMQLLQSMHLVSNRAVISGPLCFCV
jgi:hypothetical protein